MQDTQDIQMPDLENHNYHSYWQPVIRSEADPDAWQAALMQLVREALDMGLFYTRDVEAYVKQVAEFVPPHYWEIQFKDHKVEGGKMGMELYSARKALDERGKHADNQRALTFLTVGQALGSLVVNGKVNYKGVVVAFDGDLVVFHATRGGTRREFWAEARKIVAFQQAYLDKVK